MWQGAAPLGTFWGDFGVAMGLAAGANESLEHPSASSVKTTLIPGGTGLLTGAGIQCHLARRVTQALF